MPDVSELLTRDVPDADNIIRAFQDQTKIGWNHFALGRLARTWKQCFVKNFRDDQYPEEKAESAMKSMVEELWSMTLTVWKRRNDVEHGDNSVYSKQDLRMMADIIDRIYSDIKENVNEDDQWIFEKSAVERKKDTVINMITWIEIVYAMYIVDINAMEDLRIGTEHVLQRICV